MHLFYYKKFTKMKWNKLGRGWTLFHSAVHVISIMQKEILLHLFVYALLKYLLDSSIRIMSAAGLGFHV